MAMAAASKTLTLATHVLRGQWFMIFSCFLIMAASGGTYVFSIYSKDIKSSLGYNQKTLNTISFFKDIGSSVGLLSGLINEVSPPCVVLSIGAAMNFAGYFMVYLSITGAAPRPSVWQMCLYIFLGANSQAFANTGALVTAVKNFPSSRGTVIGLLKGFVGLSGAIFTQLYLALYGADNSKSLVLLIAWLPAAVSVASVHSVRIMTVVRQDNEFRVFCYFLYSSLSLAAYLMIVIVVERNLPFSRGAYGASAAVVLFLLLLLPISIVIKQELFLFNSKQNQKQQPNNVPAITIQIAAAVAAAKPPQPRISRVMSALKAPERGEDYTILQALVSVDMLILFFSWLCGIGGTLTAVDNMGQIGESLGYPAKSIGTFVSLISIWNYAGRVAAGFASEIFLAKYNFPRPLMLAGILALSCTGHLLIAFGVPNSLYVASVIIGFCFGAQVPLLCAIISEIFGLKYYSTLYNAIGVASPLSTYLLNVRVAGGLYDREAARQGESLTCVGVECFKVAFLVISAVAMLGAAVMLVLVWRTRDFYKGDIYAKFREAAPAAEGAGEVAAVKSDGDGEVEKEKEKLPC